MFIGDNKKTNFEHLLWLKFATSLIKLWSDISRKLYLEFIFWAQNSIKSFRRDFNLEFVEQILNQKEATFSMKIINFCMNKKWKRLLCDKFMHENDNVLDELWLQGNSSVIHLSKD